MASPSELFQLRKAFFFSVGKLPTETTQEHYESKYKSAPNIRLEDVWGDQVGYAYDVAAADTFTNNNPSIVKKYTLTSLTEIPGSNGQGWYLNDGGLFVRPWISPVDIPNTSTGDPAFGYQLNLYRSNDTLIPPTLGVWLPDYYSGIIIMQEGYTPADLGWGNIKATLYAYVGRTGYEVVTSSTGWFSEIFDVTTAVTSTGKVTLSRFPLADSEIVMLNGLVVYADSTWDYEISGSSIIFNPGHNLTVGDTIRIKYQALT